MRGEVRREARALSVEEALQIIRDGEYGVLATVNQEGLPSTTAMNHVLFEDGCLYFHTGIEGEKINNIRQNPNVSFFVTGMADVVYEQFTVAFSSAVVHGTMEIIEEDDARMSTLQRIAARFSDGTIPQQPIDGFIQTSMPHVAVLKLTPEHITGKARVTRRRPCLNGVQVPQP